MLMVIGVIGVGLQLWAALDFGLLGLIAFLFGYWLLRRH